MLGRFVAQYDNMSQQRSRAAASCEYNSLWPRNNILLSLNDHFARRSAEQEAQAATIVVPLGEGRCSEQGTCGMTVTSFFGIALLAELAS